MQDNEIVHKFRQIADTKCRLMSDMTKSLSVALDSNSVTETFARYTAEFEEFSDRVEKPFMKQYSERLQKFDGDIFYAKDAADREWQESTFNSFVSLLQRFKYEAPYANDETVCAAVTNFEHGTALIPKPAES